MPKRLLIALIICSSLLVLAQFSFWTYTIEAKAGTGGVIEPSGTVIVKSNENQTFMIFPEDGYRIVDVTVDSISVGPVQSYTFLYVVEDHRIIATFEKNSDRLLFLPC